MHARRALSAACARSKNRCRKVSRYRRDAVKISTGASKHSRQLGVARSLFQVHRKTARPFRSVYSGFTTLLRTPCARERGCNPIRTYTRARTTTRRPRTKGFLWSRVTELEPSLSRSTRRSRNELRELETGSERKSDRLLLVLETLRYFLSGSLSRAR